MYKQKLALIVLTACCLCLIYGCKGDSLSDTKVETNKLEDNSGEYVRVNDVSISNNDFEQFANIKRSSNPQANLSDKNITDELIATEILRQEAINEGIANRKDIIEQIKQQENNILINTLLTEKFSDLSYSEEELKAEYDRLLSLSDSSEYKARHILLQTEEDANAVIEELKGGADFIELAKQKSQGPSAPNGGDLGWFKSDTMVPPFAKAIESMEKDSYTINPVQTRFGWHVILLEDKRTADQPTFEDAKQDVQRTLTRQTIEKYVDELQSKATIVRPDSNESSDS